MLNIVQKICYHKCVCFNAPDSLMWPIVTNVNVNICHTKNIQVITFFLFWSLFDFIAIVDNDDAKKHKCKYNVVYM